MDIPFFGGGRYEVHMKMVEEAMVKVDLGLSCPRCACKHLFVVYTRPKGQQIVRVRQCRHCGKRILTREKIG